MKKWLAGLLALALVLALGCLFSRPDGRVRLSFLDVGQGDAVLIQQGHTQVLVDGGPSPGAVLAELGRRLPFWDRTLELLVLSHPHRDHLAGLVAVLERYQVRAVLQPVFTLDDTGEYDEGLYAEWRRLLAAKNVRLITAVTCAELKLGDVELAVLNPAPERLKDTAADTDNNALVLQVRCGKRSFLLTSDLQQEGERELVYRRLAPDCDVLKVAHHGADTSTIQEFLNVARPEVAVISVGQNSYGHPGAAVLARLAGRAVYRTDTQGTLEFITDGTRLWLKSER